MKHDYSAKYNNVILRPINECDLESMRCWRNDKELSKYFRPIAYITPEDQLSWYKAYLSNKDEYFFAITSDDDEDLAVGAAAIYHIKDGCAEIGKIVIGNSETRGKGFACAAMKMVMAVGKKYLGIKKYLLNAHEDNHQALNLYQGLGFREIGRHPFVKGGFELEMELSDKENPFEVEGITYIKGVLEE